MMAAAGVPVLDELEPDAVDETRPARPDQGVGRRRRPRHARRARPRRPGPRGRGRAAPRRRRRSATPPCSASRTSPPAGTSRCRSWPTSTAPSGRSASASARSSAGTRRWSRRRRPRSSSASTACASNCSRPSRAAAKAIGYTGAGTVEFLADDDGRFFFLEMNTRLQVEHPVTECTTGLDLVALQIQIADGAALAAEPPQPHGHAIEVRLYAEDPAAGWQPQIGHPAPRSTIPGASVEFGTTAAAPGCGSTAASSTASVVGVHYDPMLAKVIAWAPTRDQAARALAGALARSRIHGVVTNRDLLVNVLRHKAFLAGDTDTAFLDRHGLDALAAPLVDATAERGPRARGSAGHRRRGARRRASAQGGAERVAQRRQPAAAHRPRRPGRHARGALPADPRPACRSDAPDGVELVDALPDAASCSTTTACGARFAVAALRRRRSTSTRAQGGVRFTVVDRFPDPSRAGRARLADRADARLGRADRRRGRAIASRTASRCCGWKR